MLSKHILLFITLLLLKPSLALSNWAVGLEKVSLINQSAQQEGIENDAIGLTLQINFPQDNTEWSVGIGLYGYSDNEEFTTLVQNQGSTAMYEADSGASASRLFAEYGFIFQPSSNLLLSTKLGYNEVFASSRSITNCSNCPSEDIKIEGGIYGQVGTRFLFDSFNVGIQYNHFLESDKDIKNSIFIFIGFYE